VCVIERQLCHVSFCFVLASLSGGSAGTCEDVFQRADRENSCVGCGRGGGGRSGGGDRVGNARGPRPESPSCLPPALSTAGGSGHGGGGDDDGLSCERGGGAKSASGTTSGGGGYGGGGGGGGGGGMAAGLNRFSIVPHCFRRFLPVAVKSHSSHDVVLLCHACRDAAQVTQQKLQTTAAKINGHRNNPHTLSYSLLEKYLLLVLC